MHVTLHFNRVFQSVVGETIHKYIRRLRLERSANKLRYSDTLVTEIALDSCFDTPSAFAKAFKQCIGSSPRDYRALYREVNIMENQIANLIDIYPEKIEKTEDIDVD